MHTDCQAQGLTLVLKGTEERDSECGTLPKGPASASLPTNASTDSAQTGKSGKAPTAVWVLPLVSMFEQSR